MAAAILLLGALGSGVFRYRACNAPFRSSSTLRNPFGCAVGYNASQLTAHYAGVPRQKSALPGWQSAPGAVGWCRSGPPFGSEKMSFDPCDVPPPFCPSCSKVRLICLGCVGPGELPAERAAYPVWIRHECPKCKEIIEEKYELHGRATIGDWQGFIVGASPSLAKLRDRPSPTAAGFMFHLTLAHDDRLPFATGDVTDLIIEPLGPGPFKLHVKAFSPGPPPRPQEKLLRSEAMIPFETV